jgi:hypothetical protein
LEHTSRPSSFPKQKPLARPALVETGDLQKSEEAIQRGLEIKNPAIAVCNLSFEHVLQHVELSGLLLTSSKGPSATTAV